MFQDLIDAVQQGVKGEVVDTGTDDKFTTRPLHRLPVIALAAGLSTATLQSIVDYLGESIDEEKKNKLFVHVDGPTRVAVLAYLDDENRRETRLQAVYDGNKFQFGNKYDQTEFITLLRSQFVPSEDREKVQKLVGSLTDESSLRLEDDGVSQKTVAKTGVASHGLVENATSFVLAPFRTFPEIDQPESEFILRLHRRDGVPLISLHESDNQAWKLEAVNRLAEFLKEQTVTVPILA